MKKNFDDLQNEFVQVKLNKIELLTLFGLTAVRALEEDLLEGEKKEEVQNLASTIEDFLHLNCNDDESDLNPFELVEKLTIKLGLISVNSVALMQ